jgi:hypothetical protein
MYAGPCSAAAAQTLVSSTTTVNNTRSIDTNAASRHLFLTQHALDAHLAVIHKMGILRFSGSWGRVDAATINAVKLVERVKRISNSIGQHIKAGDCPERLDDEVRRMGAHRS